MHADPSPPIRLAPRGEHRDAMTGPAGRGAGRLLIGRRVIVTHSRDSADEIRGELSRAAELLVMLGASVVERAAIEIVPPSDTAALDRALAELDSYDWVVFTSRHAVDAVATRVHTFPSSTRRMVIGPQTLAALERYGLGPAVTPPRAIASAIPDALGDVRGKRILLPRSDLARPELPAVLREHGALVDEVIAYRTVAGAGAEAIVSALALGDADAVTFSSGSAVQAVVSAGGARLPEVWRSRARPRVVCIGPVTAAAAAAADLPVDAVAEQHDSAGLVSAVTRALADYTD